MQDVCNLISKVEELISKGIYNPGDIKNSLNLKSGELGRSIRKVYNLSLKEFLDKNVKLSCKNPSCNEMMWYQPGHYCFSTYCSKECLMLHKWQDDTFYDYMSSNTKLQMTDEHRLYLSNLTKEQWKDVEFYNLMRDKWIKYLKELYNDPVRKKIHLDNTQNSSYSFVEIVNNIQCRSSLESAFINYLIDIDYTLPINTGGLYTPTGLYYPDFEYNDIYIEIKCNWTLKSGIDRGQVDKIIWVTNNIKPVLLLNLEDKDWKEQVLNLLYGI